MTVSFRPRTGDYFLSVEYLKDLRKKNAIVFPSPYWGLFFITLEREIEYTKEILKFPSPYWGLFFIRCLPYTVVCLLGLSFRPRTGDYFLSKDAMIHMGIDFVHEFPSPYWGLFFIVRL